MAVTAIESAAPAIEEATDPSLIRQPADFESSPALLLRWAALDWLIIIGAWLAMAQLDSAIVSLLGVLIVASRLQALGALLHDACHSRRPSRAWWCVEAVAGWPIASTIVAMRYHHLRHHRFSGTALDPYRNTLINRGRTWHLVLVLRGALLPLWWTLRAVCAPVALCLPRARRFYARAFLQDRTDSDFERSAELYKCLRADLCQLAAQFLLVGAAALAKLPIVEFYFVPWILAGIANAHRVLHEHAFSQSADNSRATVYRTTNDHDFGRVLNAAFYPHNIGLHRAHHLYPTVSFVHLPQLSIAVSEVERSGAYR